jgi:hypothetical protein
MATGDDCQVAFACFRRSVNFNININRIEFQQSMLTITCTALQFWWRLNNALWVRTYTVGWLCYVKDSAETK